LVDLYEGLSQFGWRLEDISSIAGYGSLRISFWLFMDGHVILFFVGDIGCAVLKSIYLYRLFKKKILIQLYCSFMTMILEGYHIEKCTVDLNQWLDWNVIIKYLQ